MCIAQCQYISSACSCGPAQISLTTRACFIIWLLASCLLLTKHLTSFDFSSAQHIVFLSAQCQCAISVLFNYCAQHLLSLPFLQFPFSLVQHNPAQSVLASAYMLSSPHCLIPCLTYSIWLFPLAWTFFVSCVVMSRQWPTFPSKPSLNLLPSSPFSCMDLLPFGFWVVGLVLDGVIQSCWSRVEEESARCCCQTPLDCAMCFISLSASSDPSRLFSPHQYYDTLLFGFSAFPTCRQKTVLWFNGCWHCFLSLNSWSVLYWLKILQYTRCCH